MSDDNPIDPTNETEPGNSLFPEVGSSINIHHGVLCCPTLAWTWETEYAKTLPDKVQEILEIIKEECAKAVREVMLGEMPRSIRREPGMCDPRQVMIRYWNLNGAKGKQFGAQGELLRSATLRNHHITDLGLSRGVWDALAWRDSSFIYKGERYIDYGPNGANRPLELRAREVPGAPFESAVGQKRTELINQGNWQPSSLPPVPPFEIGPTRDHPAFAGLFYEPVAAPSGEPMAFQGDLMQDNLATQFSGAEPLFTDNIQHQQPGNSSVPDFSDVPNLHGQPGFAGPSDGETAAINGAYSWSATNLGGDDVQGEGTNIGVNTANNFPETASLGELNVNQTEQNADAMSEFWLPEPMFPVTTQPTFPDFIPAESSSAAPATQNTDFSGYVRTIDEEWAEIIRQIDDTNLMEYFHGSVDPREY